MSHNTIFPLSTRANYRANDIVDWLLTFDGKQIIQNSIRITGKVRVDTDANIKDSSTVSRLDVSKDVQIDGTVGIASAFQSITCSSDNQGVIENQNEHPRYVKAKSVATHTAQQLFTDCRNTTELRTGEDVHTKYLLYGNSGTTADDCQIPFSWKPDIAFNKSSQNISSKKTGGLKLSVRLATDAQFLFGADAATYSYALYDLRLEYKTVPDAGASGNLVFETIHMIKTTAESNNTSISTRVPATVQSVSIVFHRDKDLNQPIPNHLQLQQPPGVSRVEFSFNDSLTTYYNFSLDTMQEILYNYQQSWGGAYGSKSNITLPLLNHDESYGIGMPFGTYIDMSKGSKFGINLLSNINTNLKYGVFMYFRGIVQI